MNTPLSLVRRALPGSAFLLPATLTGVLSASLSATARADELYAASPTTLIQRGNPFSGDFETIGACGGQASAMVFDGTRLLISDPNGRIYERLPGQFVGYAGFDVPNDATSLAMHANNLLAGGSDGTIVRVDATTGAVLDTLNMAGGIPVSALLVIGDEIFAGSSFGIVQRGSALTGGLAFWGTCGGPVTSLAADATHLILGSSDGQIYRVNLQTGLVDGSFAAGNDAASIALQAGHLLVGGTDGTIRRLDRTNGAFKGNFESFVGVSALAVLPQAEPGVVYCYGSGCPCGNDDPEGGCASALGWGGRLGGSGSTSVAADDLQIFAFQLPRNRTSRVYMSQHTTQVPLGDGFLCAGGGGGGYPPLRFPIQNSGASGSIATPDGLIAFCAQHFPQTGQIFPGQTWHTQVWYRDPWGPCSQRFNTTNSYAVTFTP